MFADVIWAEYRRTVFDVVAHKATLDAAGVGNLSRAVEIDISNEELLERDVRNISSGLEATGDVTREEA